MVRENLELRMSVTGLNDMVGGLRRAASEARAANTDLDKLTKNRDLGGIAFDAVSAAAALKFSKSLIDSYGQLINVEQTAKQVFDDSAFAIITEQAEKATEAFGLSKRGFIESTTYIAGLGKAAGIAGDDLANFSIEMVRLAADLSAAFNTSVEDATKAIQSGFSGSSIEPLRRYNIVINDTILKQEYLALTGEKVSGVLTTQQRQMAFVSVLTKQAADYTGQWGRESDGILGSQQRLSAELENLKATLGGGFADGFVGLTNAAVGFTSALSNMPPALAQVSGAFVGIGAATLGLKSGLSAVGRYTADADGRFGQIVNSSIPKLQTGMNVLGGAMFAYSLYAADAAEEQRRLNAALDELAQSTGPYTTLKQLTEVAKDGRGVFAKAGDQIKAMLPWEQNDEAKQQRLLFGTKALLDELEKFGNPAATRAVLDLAEANERWAASLDIVAPSTAELTDLYNRQVQEAAALANSQYDLNDSISVAQFEMADATVQAKLATDSYEDLTSEVDKLSERLDEAAERFGKLNDEAAEASESRFDGAIAFRETITGLEELAKLRAESSGSAADELDILKQQKDVQGSLNDTIAGRLADVETFLGRPLSFTEKLDWTERIADDLRAELPAEAAAYIDAWEAEFEARRPQLEIEAKIADTDLGAQLRGLVAEASSADAGKIIVDVLTNYQGLSSESVQTVLDAIPEDKRTLVLKAALDKAEAEGKLDDEEYVAEIIADMSFEQAERQLDEFQNSDPRVQGMKLKMEADLAAARRDLDEFRRLYGSKTLKVPVEFEIRRPGFIGPPAPVGAASEFSTLSAEADAQSGFTGRTPIMVQARRPIAGNTYVTINPPPGAKADEIIAAVDVWRRRNGSIAGPWQ